MNATVSAAMPTFALPPAGAPGYAEPGGKRGRLLGIPTPRRPHRGIPPGQPAARSLVVKSKDPRLAASGLDGLGDPTLGGGTLTLTNPTTAESVSYPLPAVGWRARPKREPIAAGYQYSDPVGTYGPCHAVSLKSGRKLVIKCRGAGFGFTLDEASQGSLAVRLTTGSGIAGEGFRYCLRFDGTVLDDRPGLFLAKDAPAPPTCVGDP